MFISIWVSRLEIAEFPDSVRRSAGISEVGIAEFPDSVRRYQCSPNGGMGGRHSQSTSPRFSAHRRDRHRAGSFRRSLDFLFITFLLHFFLSWTSSLSISSSAISASTLSNHVLCLPTGLLPSTLCINHNIKQNYCHKLTTQSCFKTDPKT